MTYVMADIHGEYDRFLKMLELIEFSPDDELYILGDIVDRGAEPVKLLTDLMERPNVTVIMGNHDFLALDVLRQLSVDVTEDNFSTQIDTALMNEIQEWMKNGGGVTMEQFGRLDKEQRADIINYMSEFPLFETVETDEHAFILVHAGLGNFRKGKKLKDYTPEELLLTRNNPDVRYFDDENIFVISGHTPTLKTTGKAEIYKNSGNICIDCGAVFGGRLACLCLETMEEFYV